MKPIMESWRGYLTEAKQDIVDLSNELLDLIHQLEGFQAVKFKNEPTPRRTTISFNDVGDRKARIKLNQYLASSSPEITAEAGDHRRGTYKGVPYSLHQGTAQGLRIANKGDVAEGVLGAALAHVIKKYPARGINQSKIVTLLRAIDQNPDESPSKKKVHKSITMNSHDGTGNKEIKLDIALNSGNYRDLVSDEKRVLLDNVYANVIRYASSDYFRNFIKNNLFDDLKSFDKAYIKVIGAIEGGVSKADVRIYKDNTLLWSHSLKAGSRQLSQVGGKNAENVFGYITKVFGLTLPSSYIKAYGAILPSPSREQFYEANQSIFKQIFKYAKEQLSSDQAGYTKKLLQSLRASAISVESNVDLLNLEKDKFRLLNFEDVLEISDYINLDIDLGTSSTGYPILRIFDRRQSVVPTKSSTLFTFRPKFESDGPVLRFYVEYGDLVDYMLTKVNE